MSHLYYNPEDYGLTTVGGVNWDAGDAWGFDLTVVWKDAEGKLYWSSDSGCSCPSPFEHIYEVDQLNTGSTQELLDYLNLRKISQFPDAQKVDAEIVELIAKVL